MTVEAAAVEEEEMIKSEEKPVPKTPKAKRNIVHFTGDNPIVINLDHVSIMRNEGKTIYFDFYSKTQSIDMLNEQDAKVILQTLLNIWSGDVVE